MNKTRERTSRIGVYFKNIKIGLGIYQSWNNLNF